VKRSTVIALLSVFLFAKGIPIFAQLVADPNDRLYTDLSLWQDRGLITNLPPLRPYPIQVVQKLLSDVRSSGDASDSDLAKRYLDDIEGIVNAHAVGSALARTDLSNVYVQVELDAIYQGTLSPFITYSGSLGALGVSAPADYLLPKYERPVLDYVNDGAVAPLGTSGLTPRLSMIGGTGFGNESMYFQAGILRSSFGPFWGDNVVLSPFAPQSGQLSFVYRQGFFTYTQLLIEISATQNDGGGGPVPDKFLSFHSFEVYPWPWLTLGIFESVVWGKRFDLLYLLPFTASYYYAQGMVSFPDNSFIGISGGVRFPAAVKADFILYFDDASFNDLIRLHFNTKLLLAFQGGVSWTPNLPLLTRLSINGLIVTPYTYSHTDNNGDIATSINYLNYTNAGQNMGPSLQPDSARIELNALVRPFIFIDLNVFGRLILHGNGSEGIIGGGNGTIFDSGFLGGLATFSPPYPLPAGMVYTRFLSQAVMEKTFQVGFDVKAYVDTPIGQIQALLSYTFEYALSDTLGQNNDMNNYVTLGAGLKY
jgi:hypothetical protein